jgi:hypothetical protein
MSEVTQEDIREIGPVSRADVSSVGWSFVVSERRRRVAELYLKGLTQAEIARETDTTPHAVCSDIAAVRDLWRQGAVKDFTEAVGTELARLDVLEKEYWDAWMRSRGDLVKHRAKRKRTPDGEGDADERMTQREKRDGSAGFLEGVRWCIDRRIKLLGLDAPTKHKHVHQVIPIEQRRERALALLDAISQ